MELNLNLDILTGIVFGILVIALLLYLYYPNDFFTIIRKIPGAKNICKCPPIVTCKIPEITNSNLNTTPSVSIQTTG